MSVFLCVVRRSSLKTTCSPRRRFRELRDAHNKAMEDMATEVEAKEHVHVQEINTLERKLLIDKGNMQKVRQREKRKMPQTKRNGHPG